MADRHTPIDVLRGLVIALMGLDHIRGFIAPAGANPTDFSTTSTAFFLVRWVTHLCAPSFVFLMGAVACLQFVSKPSATRTFLLSRGVWLIALEVSWISFCWDWNIAKTNLGVLWALGGSMVLLACLVGRLGGAHRMAWVGLALIVGLEIAAIKPAHGFTQLLFQPGSMSVFGHHVGGAYALLPWFGVAALGFGMGPWLLRARPRHMAGLGAVFIGLFVAYRWVQWTDPDSWIQQSRPLMTIADFLSPSKYPPSISYVLMTLGMAFLLLAGPARVEGPINRVLNTFGRVPMFFYLIHLPLAHVMGNVYAWTVYGQSRVPSTEPVSIALILGAWIVLLALCWPVCRRWEGLKKRRREWGWLRYF